VRASMADLSEQLSVALARIEELTARLGWTFALLLILVPA
jgi:hypothetical protein